jgi:glutamate N-acetyltransferase/amino-acid N-acetyltransferase
VVTDGEGASKLIEVQVINGKSNKNAREIAASIANSPLVKSAIAACDPNWGRIIMAIGKADKKIQQEKIELFIGNHLIAKNGAKVQNYSEELVHQYLKENNQVKILVNLNYRQKQNKNSQQSWQNGNKTQQNYSATFWGCDLNESYVTINKDYRS